MKNYCHYLAGILAIGLASIGLATAQDATDKTVEKVQEAAKSPQVKSIMNDPRFRNMLRTVQDNPENALNSVRDNPDEAVSAATSLFQKKLGESGKSVDDLTNKAQSAIEKLSSKTPATMPEKPAIKEKTAVDKKPAPTPPRSSVPPATRSALTAAQSVPGNKAPLLPTDSGVVETSTPAQPIPAAFAPNMNLMAGSIPESIPDAPPLKAGDAPAPKALEPRYSASAGRSTNTQGSRVITARESLMDETNRKITFTGDVYLKDDANKVTMKCDKLQIFLTEKGATVKDVKGKETPISKAIATGGTVEIRKVTPTGKVQTALARRVDYNAITQDAMLSGGPPSLKDGGTSVQTKSQDSKILLRGNGKYEILGSERHTIVVPITNGKKLSNDLDSSSNPVNR